MADTGFLLGITHAQLEELANLGVGVDVVAEQFNGFNARFGLKVHNSNPAYVNGTVAKHRGKFARNVQLLKHRDGRDIGLVDSGKFRRINGKSWKRVPHLWFVHREMKDTNILRSKKG